MIRLKNGSEELSTLVAVIMMSLKNLIERDPISFFELVSKARDPNHEVFSKHQTDVLVGLSLMEPGGTLHNSVRNVTLSAVTGDDLDMTLGDPVAR